MWKWYGWGVEMAKEGYNRSALHWLQSNERTKVKLDIKKYFPDLMLSKDTHINMYFSMYVCTWRTWRSLVTDRASMISHTQNRRHLADKNEWIDNSCYLLKKRLNVEYPEFYCNLLNVSATLDPRKPFPTRVQCDGSGQSVSGVEQSFYFAKGHKTNAQV